MVRAKSVLNMMMMSFGALGLVSVLWVLYGYSLAFGDDAGGGLVGNFDFVGLKGLIDAAPLGGVAGESPASRRSPSSASSDVRHHHRRADQRRHRRPGQVRRLDGLRRLWATLVYFPVAHWVFAFDGYTGATGGWIANNLKAIDFAGGTAVHINAGAAGLALALVLGKRDRLRQGGRCGRTTCRSSCSAPACCGSAGSASTPAPRSAPTTPAARRVRQHAWSPPRRRSLGWLVVEKIRDGTPPSLGAASGAVAGLVAITPACCVGHPARRDRPRRSSPVCSAPSPSA